MTVYELDPTLLAKWESMADLSQDEIDRYVCDLATRATEGDDRDALYELVDLIAYALEED